MDQVPEQQAEQDQDDLQVHLQQFLQPWPLQNETYLGYTLQDGDCVRAPQHIRNIQNPFLRFMSADHQIEIYYLHNWNEPPQFVVGFWNNNLAKQVMPLLSNRLISLLGRLVNSGLKEEEIKMLQKKQTDTKTKSKMKQIKIEDSFKKVIQKAQQDTQQTVNYLGGGFGDKLEFRVHFALKRMAFEFQYTPTFRPNEQFYYAWSRNFQAVYAVTCKLIQDIDQEGRNILDFGEQRPTTKSKIDNRQENEEEESEELPNDLFTNNENDFPETNAHGLVDVLKPHQRQALTWLLYREGAGGGWRPDNHNNLIWKKYKTQKNQTFYFCPYTGQNSLEKESFTGGILADDNGFDEKLTMTALILRNPKPQGVKRIKTTLIVTNNQMINWGRVLQQTNLNVLVLQNDQAPVNLQNYDVVIISYYAIMQDWKIVKENWSRGIIDVDLRSIYDYQYYRVILDQASKIKNQKTLRAQACLNLDTHYRWCVTSQSLIQNSFDDLIVLLQFINQKQMPCPNAWWFKKYITGPYKRNENIQIIQRMLRNIMVPELILRRTQQSTYGNGNLMIISPIIQQYNQEIEFTEDETNAYLIMQGQLMDERYQMYSSKLRKICDYSQMSDIRPVVNRISQKKLVQLLPNRTPEQRIAFEHEALDEIRNFNKRCQVCDEPDQILKVSSCKHYICQICYRQRKNNNNLARCHFPECHNHNTRYISIKYTLSEEWKQTYVRPSKIIIIRQILNDIPPGEKCVIFTQFIEMIEVLIHDLRHTDNPITCYFLHGAMPHFERNNQLNQFNQAQEKVVLVASLKANEGQDLTRAKHIIFVEPWWNYAVQDQAIQRVKVNERGFSPNQVISVHKLITQLTIEEEIAEANEQRRNLTRNQEIQDDIYDLIEAESDSDSDSD